ncbi:hypothetical protein [Gordonia sp. NPDC003950]
MTELPITKLCHGVWSFAELRTFGFSQREVARLVASGNLRQLRRGWYAADYAESAVVQAVLAGGVLTCLSALELQGVWVPPLGDQVHVRGCESAHRRLGGKRFCRRYGPPAPEICSVDDIRLSLAHVIKCADDETIVVVCDSLLNLGLLDMSDLEEIFASAPQHKRDLLGRCDGRAESGTETMVRLRLLLLGIRVVVQPEIPGIGWVDLLVGERLLIEVDSKQFHDRSEQQRELDRVRDEEAHRRGYIPLRLSYKRVVYEWPKALTTINAIVRRRDHAKPPAIAPDSELTASSEGIDDPDTVHPDTDHPDPGEPADYWNDPDFTGC